MEETRQLGGLTTAEKPANIHSEDNTSPHTPDVTGPLAVTVSVTDALWGKIRKNFNVVTGLLLHEWKRDFFL